MTGRRSASKGYASGMTPDDIRAWYAALSAGDVRPLVDRLTDDCVLEFPGSVFGATVEGRRKIKVFLRQNQRLFENGLVFTVQWAEVMGDKAVAQWTNAGRTKSGVEYANRGVTVFTLKDGRITRIEDYLDTETILETWPR